jgi:hypothetical protein
MGGGRRSAAAALAVAVDCRFDALMARTLGPKIIDSSVHSALLGYIAHHGFAPTAEEVAEAAGVARSEVLAAYRRLENGHGLVLHPGTAKPWVVHPFSLSPTAVWVQAPNLGWWAPCLWCAAGVIAVAAPSATVHACVGGEAERMSFEVADGRLCGDDWRVHFAIPPRDAWSNVHHFCSMVLPFRDEGEVRLWCRRHGFEPGAVLSLRVLLELGRAWYGRHLDPGWVKWTPREAQAIFAAAGLTDAFWTLPVAEDRPF